MVWSNLVVGTVAVRFAWGNNPEINLFYKIGLPSVPLRTDTWKGITE